YSYGQQVVVTGTLENPPIYEDFDYREYLEGRGVLSVMRTGQIAIRPGMAGSWFTRTLLGLNHQLRLVVERILPQPEAGLLQGVLLGADDALPSEAAADFRTAGLTHILVVSGFNISILMQLILFLAQKAVRRQLALLLALIGITMFGSMVGFTAPVLRAWLMGLLTILAVITGRKAHALTSLAAASLVMTSVNPLMAWSVSFQLSFAATLALILVQPILDRLIRKTSLGKFSGTLTELLTCTLAAQLLTLPLIWHYFGQVSLVALIANILVLPLQPLILYAGAAVTMAGAIWIIAGRVLALLVWPFLRYTILVPHWLAKLPLASVSLPRISLPGMIAFYAAGAVLLYLLSRQPEVRSGPVTSRLNLKPWLLSGGLVVVFISISSLAAALPDGKVHIAVLDVGQGDAILITTPGGSNVLIDGGVDGLTLRSRLGEMLPLSKHQIELVIATHGDADHIGGLVDLPRYYRIMQAGVPPDLGASSAAGAWEASFASEQIPQSTLNRGDIIQLDSGLTLEVLNPADGTATDSNASSLVLRLQWGAFSMLLTGDMENETEQSIINQYPNLTTYLLKVAHHGSDSSSSDSFLRAVNPQMAVISVGIGNKLGHPTQLVLDRLAALGCVVWRTDLSGTIEFVTDGKKIQVRSAR
ncbi:MAG: DNA internalization-related competence protein ComEC/Rec2, partial [Anaerolineae bacterium]